METSHAEAEHSIKQHVRYLFISGNNLDKRDQVHLSQIIDKDKDIQHLIRKANLGILRSLFMIVFIAAIIALSCIPDVRNTVSSYVSEETNGPQCVWVSGFIILLALSNIVKYIILIKKEVSKLTLYCKLKLKKLVPRKPMELWHLYPASIIDGQIVQYVQRLLDKAIDPGAACRLVYAGEPYMSYFLLDSIDIYWQFHKPMGLCRRHLLQFRFRQFYQRYAIQTVFSNAIGVFNNKTNSNIRRRQTSDCVFGLLFASRYLKPVVDRYSDGGKVLIDLSAFKDRPEEERQLIKNTLQYFTNPYSFTFTFDESIPSEEENSPAVTLCVGGFNIRSIKKSAADSPAAENAAQSKNKPPKKRWSKLCAAFYATNPIHIPVKRLFLQPPANTAADSWLMNDLSKANADTIVLLGGAEQSLAQCYLLNLHRWSENPYLPCHIGFAENEFDLADDDRYSFLVGSEGFVYGYRFNKMVAPDETPDTNKRNQAERFQLNLDKQKVIILYGYHAISTKILSAKLFQCRIIKAADADESKYEERVFSMNDIDLHRTYIFSSANSVPTKTNLDFDVLRQLWDKNNPIDNPLLDPETDLRQIRTQCL